MTLKAKLFISLLLLGLLSASPVRADSTTVGDISKELICQCGCSMVLSNCSHAECASREAMTTSIRQAMAQGKSKAEIIQSFVQQYGEQVLAAPPKRGFNLTVWVLPFAALVIGGVIIYAVARAWLRQGRRHQINDATSVQEEDEEYRRRLEEELEKFTEQDFR